MPQELGACEASRSQVQNSGGFVKEAGDLSGSPDCIVTFLLHLGLCLSPVLWVLRLPLLKDAVTLIEL